MPKPSRWHTWPEVPKSDRPKRMYVNETLDAETKAALEGKGWDPQDVRLLPNKTDAHRADGIKAWLEGVRQTSIAADPKVVKLIELEARTYGLVGTKPTIESKQAESENPEVNIDELLDFESTRAKLKRAPARLPSRQGRQLGTHGGSPYDEELEEEEIAAQIEEGKMETTVDEFGFQRGPLFEPERYGNVLENPAHLYRRFQKTFGLGDYAPGGELYETPEMKEARDKALESPQSPLSHLPKEDRLARKERFARQFPDRPWAKKYLKELEIEAQKKAAEKALESGSKVSEQGAGQEAKAG